MPKKFKADRGKGPREYGVDISELNINMVKQEVHVVCRVTDTVDFTGAEHVAFIQEPEFSSIMSSAGRAAPLFDLVSEAVWLYLLDKEADQITLGRPAAVDEIIPVWADV